MPRESLCLKVPKIHGEKAIVLANRLKLVDDELEIQRSNNHILIPLARCPSENELKAFGEQAPELKVISFVFSERKKATTSYVALLERKLPSHLLSSLPHSLDVVGDIAIMEIPSELNAHARAIGEAFLKANKNVRTVLAKAGAVSGTYRVRDFEIIAGEPRTYTVHKEHGCKYYVDLARAYFSPRLSHEHERVALLVSDGETVVDLFAGVGPFTVLIAKENENGKVHAVDINPDAIEFLRKNIRLNRVENRAYALLGDARQVVKERLHGIADRVVMNLPENAMDFVDAACEALKPAGGIAHFYCFVDAIDSLEDAQRRLARKAEEYGRKVEVVLFSRFVRGTAPCKWQIVLDAKIA